MKLLSLKLLLGLLFFLSFVRPSFAQQAYIPFEITDTGIPFHFPGTDGVFFTKNLNINFEGGAKVVLSLFGEANGDSYVDNAIKITVTKPDGSVGIFTQDYHINCTQGIYKPPADITHLFGIGNNSVKVEMINSCGGPVASSPLYLSYLGPSEPQPFLDLPWNYETNEMTFNETATSINAFFDHEYPFLSTNLTEPSQIVRYFDTSAVNDDYSAHDGYDYGSSAKTKLDTPLLAAADGEASFLGSCEACGNAILIDHKNGFQTRYYHMQPDGLIVSKEGEKVNVIKGQQIGKVGYSGNVDPDGEGGSHIHFMVIQDKNKDGDFKDNIPDGLVDPFGWQSTEPDPWEKYSFTYAGEQRTGNKSYYLFTKQLDNLRTDLTANQAVFNVGKTKLEFPSGSTDKELKLTLDSFPNFNSNILNSLGSIIKLEAKDLLGNLITTFLKNFTLTIDFSQFDLTRYKTETLSIYSSQDGKNWTKEETILDLNTKTASATLNHFTYFALMAERADTIAPTTTPVLEGQKGTNNNFRSNVTLNLNATDNENGLGVEFTAYGFEDQPWQTYSTPLIFSEEGNYKVYFYSQDKDDNLEETKSVEFSIDKTIPEAKIEVDRTAWDLKVTTDATDSAQLTKKPGKKLGQFTYTIKDPAGNTLTLDTFHLDTKYVDLFKLYSLQYNSDPKILPPDNFLNTNYIFYTPKTRPEIKVINQNFFIKNQTTFVILADAIKQKTILNILENGTKRKEEKPGIILLKLQTNQGKLESSY